MSETPIAGKCNACACGLYERDGENIVHNTCMCGHHWREHPKGFLKEGVFTPIKHATAAAIEDNAPGNAEENAILSNPDPEGGSTSTSTSTSNTRTSPLRVEDIKDPEQFFKGACFFVEDVQRFKDAVNGAFVKGGESGLRTQSSCKTRLTLHCPESDCDVVVAFRKRTANNNWKATKVIKVHNCKNDGQPVGRKRAHPFRVISAAHKEVGAWTSSASSARAAESLLNTAKMAGAPLTKNQAKKHARRHKDSKNASAGSGSGSGSATIAQSGEEMEMSSLAAASASIAPGGE